MKKNFWLGGLLLLVAAGCTENNETPVYKVDSVLFGHFFGMCEGEQCVEIFARSGTGMLEDRVDSYPGIENPYNGRFEAIPSTPAVVARVQRLEQQMAAVLGEHPSDAIGQPDAGDWGGYYIQMNVDGENRQWLLDKNTQNLEGRYAALADSIGAVIAAVQAAAL